VGVRTDEHVVADDDGMAGPAADQRVLHDHGAGAHVDLAVLGGQHGTEQDPCVGAEAHRAAEHRRRRDVGARVDLRDVAAMFDQHPAKPATAPGDVRPAGARSVM
jgi:hypothetical protein